MIRLVLLLSLIFFTTRGAQNVVYAVNVQLADMDVQTVYYNNTSFPIAYEVAEADRPSEQVFIDFTNTVKKILVTSGFFIMALITIVALVSTVTTA